MTSNPSNVAHGVPVGGQTAQGQMFDLHKIGAVTSKPVISIPGGPNVIIDIEHGLESTLDALPMLSVLIPQLSVITPFIPVIKAGLKMAEDTQKAVDSDDDDPMEVFTSHLPDVLGGLVRALGKDSTVPHVDQFVNTIVKAHG